MTSRKPACRVCSISASAVALIVGHGGSARTATRVPDPAARLVAAQRILADAGATLDRPSLSYDGRFIAFSSQHHEPSRRSCCQKVYVLDRSTGLLTDENIGSDGAPMYTNSRAPSLSSDGRLVAFETMNVPSGDLPLAGRQVVVRDRGSAVVRTPRGVGGERPNGDSGDPVLSGNGLAVVFASDATNLVAAPSASNGRTHIYLWRLDDATIARVSVASNNVAPASGVSYSASISGDGELVAFASNAPLVPEDTNSIADVYLRDLRRGATSLVSRGTTGLPANGPSHSPALSADGRYIAFVSAAGNLVPNDRNQASDVFIYDVSAAVTTLVSATSKGTSGNATSFGPTISADGRYVIYESVASNLGSRPPCPQRISDTNLLPDVYLLDRMTRCVTRVSGSPDREWWTPSVLPAIDGSGSVVVFSSTQPVNDDDLSTDFDLFLLPRPHNGS